MQQLSVKINLFLVFLVKAFASLIILHTETKLLHLLAMVTHLLKNRKSSARSDSRISLLVYIPFTRAHTPRKEQLCGDHAWDVPALSSIKYTHTHTHTTYIFIRMIPGNVFSLELFERLFLKQSRWTIIRLSLPNSDVYVCPTLSVF